MLRLTGRFCIAHLWVDETGGVLLAEAGDLNGDGIVDIRMVFPDGNRQNLYLLT